MKRAFALTILAVAFAGSAFAQAPDLGNGFVPYATMQDGAIDSMNLDNGNVILHVPIASFPQRGGKLRLTFDIVENNKGWYEYNTGHSAWWAFAGSGTWVVPDQSMVAKLSTTKYVDDQGKSWTIHMVSAVTPDGSSHEILGEDTRFWSTGESVDGTGIQWANPTLTDNNGIQYTGGVVGGSPLDYTPGNVTDSNGNEITYGTSGWTDTLGRVIPGYPTTGNMLATPGVTSTTTYCPENSVSALQWNLPAFNGTTSVIKFCYANFNYATDFGISGIEESSGTMLLLNAVVLPNLTSWIFSYDSYLCLTAVTFPTGGGINYTWETITPFQGRVVSTRTFNANDGTGSHTWKYGYQSPNSQNTLATDPSGNDTEITYGATTEAIQTYSGSYSSGTLLKTVTTTYTPYQSNPLGIYGVPGGGINHLPISELVAWPNGKQSQTTTSYDTGFQYGYYNYDGSEGYGYASYGLPVLKAYSDYGSGAPGGILKQISNIYQWQGSSNYLSANLLALVQSSKVQDGSGNTCAETDYTYDSPSRIFSSGISTQHITPPGLERGNISSVTRQLASASTPCTSSPSWTPITSYTNVFDTGTTDTSIDPLGYQTAYAYSTTYAGAYPTTITNAANQITTLAYDSNIGLVTSIKDPNSQTSSYTYDNMARIASANYPDGGSTTITHHETTTPFTATETTAITSGLNKVTTNVFDGLGRLSQTQITDAQGTIYTDTTYDANGRKSTVSNPYRSTSDSTYGVTTYQYDSLNRTTKVIPPDGTMTSNNVTTQYCAGTTLVEDQASHWRRSTTDGLGRLIEVDEPNSSTIVNVCPGTGEPIWVTNYTYDTLDDLLTVVQGGSHNRSFIYDSLKRLTSSTNPETGTTPVTYTYDSDDNVKTKSDARSLTITYAYDNLNRMTGRTYSNGDPAVSYAYDQSTCVVVSTCYNVGRRTSMTDAGGSESWAYDKMGREWGESRTTAGVTKTAGYTYDLMGGLLTLTYPSGRTLTYTPNDLDDPVEVEDVPNSLIYASGGTYAPQQSLSGLVSGGAYNSTFIYNNRLQPCWIYTTTAAALPTNTLCTATASAATAIDLKYNFNFGVADNGNVIGITNNRDTTRSQQFTYDQVNRLTSGETTSTYSTSPSHCWGEAYVYDNQSSGSGEYGNLTNINVVSNSYNGCTQESLSISSGTANQIASFSYDQVGNTLNDTHNTYAYNAESEIKSGGGVNYTYDGDGNRVEKNTIKIYWYGAGATILDESDTSGNITDEFVFLGGKRIAHRYASGVINYYAEDMLGTNRVILPSAAGSPCYDADFYPFGGERAYTSTCAENYKFEGKKRDQETGNDDFGARYYTSSFGRWESPDWSSVPAPVPYANLTNPQTLNLYAMARDNPETFADLDGHLLQGLPGIDPFPSALSVSQQRAWQNGPSQQAQNTANQPAPTNPDGTPKPPTNDVPKLPDGKPPGWKPGDPLVPNEWVPGTGTTDRPTRWDPKYPIPGQSPPNVSWDPSGHWDHNDGKGDRTRWLPGGGGQVDHWGVPIPSAKQIVIGIGAVGTGYLIYRGIRMLPSVVFPPLWPTIPLNAAIP